MDDLKFDSLTRALANGSSRRTLLKILGASTLAGVAGVAVSRVRPVAAQGTLVPGELCESDDQCLYGECSAAPEGEAICNCGQPERAWIGCPCITGADDACGGGTPVCCTSSPDDPPGTEGTCISGMAECYPPVDECSALQTSCEETGCCAEDTECGANGFCYGCYSGTEDPCGPFNEAYGADYICCTYGDTTPGAVGYCVAESACVVEPPNTGIGSANAETSWIVPAAAVGVAAAVIAHKSRNVSDEPGA
jgi:hypothetical protein